MTPVTWVYLPIERWTSPGFVVFLSFICESKEAGASLRFTAVTAVTESKTRPGEYEDAFRVVLYSIGPDTDRPRAGLNSRKNRHFCPHNSSPDHA